MLITVSAMYPYSMSENGIGSNRATPSAEQFRRRRIIAGVIAVLVLLLLIWGMVALVGAIRGSGDENSNAGAVATATSAPFSDFTERPSATADGDSASAEATDTASAEATDKASESAEPTESAQPEETQEATEAATEEATPEATEAAEPTASATEEATPEPTETTAAAATACTATDLKVALTADKQSYAAGANPALAVTYTNAAGNPCLVGGEANSIDINITSGPAQVYNSSKCQQEIQPENELAAGASNTVVMTWNRQLNVLGCDSAATIKPGYYWATATVNGVASTPTRIIVTG